MKSNRKYEEYIHSHAWKEKADARMEKDHHTCCVCGREATEVHHLTYEHFREERMDDLVSLCHECHRKAEELYDSSAIPWALAETRPNNFMAAMRVDAMKIAPVVLDYLKTVRGDDFDSLMALRQPIDEDKKHYWGVLRKAVYALCRKRYMKNCAEDRMDIVLRTITNHAVVTCLAEIEHWIRNSVQGSLHEIVLNEYARQGTWKNVSLALNTKVSTVRRLKTDDGTSAGPSLDQEVLYYCFLDAAAGISPLKEFTCLTDEDYRQLDAIADHMAGKGVQYA